MGHKVPFYGPLLMVLVKECSLTNTNSRAEGTLPPIPQLHQLHVTNLKSGRAGLCRVGSATIHHVALVARVWSIQSRMRIKKERCDALTIYFDVLNDDMLCTTPALKRALRNN